MTLSPRTWMLLAVVHGVMVRAGAAITVRHLLTWRPAAVPAAVAHPTAA